MANRKKQVYKPKPMTEGKRNLIQGLLQEYDIQSADDIQEALKDLLSGTIQDMLETEMDSYLGYEIATKDPASQTTETAQSQKLFVASMGSSRSMFLRIDRAPLNLRCFQSVRKTFL